MPTAAGIALGIFAHTFLVTLMVLWGTQQQSGLLETLGVLGGFYLGFLALQTFYQEGKRSKKRSEEVQLKVPVGAFSHLRQGFWTNTFNPKAAAFLWSMLVGLSTHGLGAAYFMVIAIFIFGTFFWFWFLGGVLGTGRAQRLLHKIKRPINIFMGLLLLTYSILLLSQSLR